MSYVDAVSNAIAARGNALSQGAIQSGQVWGNLARNLGQIPGQAIAFHQQRQDALQNHELKKLALEDSQREAELEKDLIRITNSGLPPDQIAAEIENRVSQSPKHFLELQRFKSQRAIQQQQLDVAKSQREFTQRSGQPGTEFEHTITPPSNALAPGEMAPQVPVPQRQMEFEKMVHPMNALGIRPPTDVDVRERQAATDALAMNKYAQQQAILETDREKLAGVKAGYQKDKPINLSDLEGYVENMAQEHKRVSGQEATPGQRAQWLKEIMVARAQAGVQGSPSQFIGFGPDGKPIGYVPSKKGTAGKLASVEASSVPPGPIISKTESAQEGMNANNAKSGLRAVSTVRAMLADPTILAQASIPGSPGARKFDTARKEMVDVLTRLRTGAALNTDEEAFYTGQAPVLLDLTDPEAIEYKLKMFEDVYTPIATRRTGGTAPTGGGGGPKADISPAEAAAELARRKQAKAGKK